jgi:hypothetical protein
MMASALSAFSSPWSAAYLKNSMTRVIFLVSELVSLKYSANAKL